MASMLSDVVNHGTGYTARQNGFRLPAAGKTGSTDGHADAWFIGFTPRLAAGVWVGFDQPQPIMRRGFASAVAVHAWAGFMKQATSGSKAEWLSRPPGVSPIRRCRESGGLATEYCELHGPVDNDLVSIGRAPDLCTLHTSAAVATPTSPVVFSIKRSRPY
jgi:penicillin-binding protein 1A